MHRTSISTPLSLRVLTLQVCQPNGEVIITNDGATILNKMNVTQPAAKMLVELAKAQVCSQTAHYAALLLTPSPLLIALMAC